MMVMMERRKRRSRVKQVSVSANEVVVVSVRSDGEGGVLHL